MNETRVATSLADGEAGAVGSKLADDVRAQLGATPVLLAYGGIALDAGDMSGFHNATSVVLAFFRMTS